MELNAEKQRRQFKEERIRLAMLLDRILGTVYIIYFIVGIVKTVERMKNF